jgi:hypothetical protein
MDGITCTNLLSFLALKTLIENNLIDYQEIKGELLSADLPLDT